MLHLEMSICNIRKKSAVTLAGNAELEIFRKHEEIYNDFDD